VSPETQIALDPVGLERSAKPMASPAGRIDVLLRIVIPLARAGILAVAQGLAAAAVRR
jgi:hypothetical protein